MPDDAQRSAADVRRRLEERAVAHMDREHPAPSTPPKRTTTWDGYPVGMTIDQINFEAP